MTGRLNSDNLITAAVTRLEALRRMLICTRPDGLPHTSGRAWRAQPMNAYVLIAGFSGVAVFCAVALKSFGAQKR